MNTTNQPDDLRRKIEHELDEMMIGAENYFGVENPKRRGHIGCALDRIMEHIKTSAAAPNSGTPAQT